MIDADERREILKRGRPEIAWEGEPLLGGTYGEDEVEAAAGAMRAAMDVTRGFGAGCGYIQRFEEAFAAYVGAKHAVMLNSAGPGLDMAMRYLELAPGDEVIVPAINFVAAPLAVLGAGGQVVWGEVDPATLELDPGDVARKITARTRAIFPVHMNGLAAPMDALNALAHEHPHPKHGPLAVIGDAARACGGGYKDGKIGQEAFATVFSFHTMKNICTLGEGGCVTTDDDAFAEFCRSTRFYGAATDIWGTSNVMTQVQAAVGLVQLKKLDGFVAARRRLAKARDAMLEGVPELTLPCDPPDRAHSYYLYTCLVDDAWAGAKRDALIEMAAQDYGVRYIVANPPAYEARRVLRDHTPGQRLPLSERLGQRLFCVPIHPAMSDADNAFLAASLIECIERLR